MPQTLQNINPALKENYLGRRRKVRRVPAGRREATRSMDSVRASIMRDHPPKQRKLR